MYNVWWAFDLAGKFISSGIIRQMLFVLSGRAGAVYFLRDEFSLKEEIYAILLTWTQKSFLA